MPKDYIRMGILRDFLQLSSPELQWCCPEGKAIEFFSRTPNLSSFEKKNQMTFLQDSILLPHGNIILLQEKTTLKSSLPFRSPSSWKKIKVNNINWFNFSILSIISHPSGFIYEPTPISKFCYPDQEFFFLGFELIYKNS